MILLHHQNLHFLYIYLEYKWNKSSTELLLQEWDLIVELVKS